MRMRSRDTQAEVCPADTSVRFSRRQQGCSHTTPFTPVPGPDPPETFLTFHTHPEARKGLGHLPRRPRGAGAAWASLGPKPDHSLQNKLLELNSERCRDAQRAEELCAKNRQLREQQRALKENLRALENRLRAGLCDRCMVTQELARKKQQEFESSLLQSLQHVFLLTTELTRLQEENDALKEEVKQLRGPGAKPQFREGAPEPPSPLLLPSLGTRKAVTAKPPEGHEEMEGGHAERPVGYGTSPVAKISPGTNLPDPWAPDTSPQHISNQLHGTIAVVRPGSRACSANRGSVNGTSPLPPPRSRPPSPPGGHGLPLDR
ncbi:RBBP8 N-terminal-like protein isoform X1 [Physeter macrocephalus]|uniref:RBBP8 N-terminal-like protein isoform X1 n=1 Tax=Physeter macrocephalus TaxID=9755 RepID=A0A9W2X5S0_PHYMC|nr:RBBP8 N-terminal-like protein isoform X1 [Physeter catodon]